VTLLVFDASLPGGLIEGTGGLRYAQTMSFTTLVFCQVFNVFNARSDEASAFRGVFRNGWLMAALALSVVLQAVVVYAPPLQTAFGTMALTPLDWARSIVAASAVLWFRELAKAVMRARRPRTS
jgi:Ca2+-transporting ATPase